jgi:hypothetical protein
MREASLESNAKNRLMVAKFHSLIDSLLDEMLTGFFFAQGETFNATSSI